MVGVVLILTCDYFYNLFLKEVLIVLSLRNNNEIKLFDSRFDSGIK